MRGPLGYFITFHTYGTWLHGDQRGSVDRRSNQWRGPFLPDNAGRRRASRGRQKHAATKLGTEQRRIVVETVREVCRLRGWRLHAVHARANHVHLVISSTQMPDRIMNDLKAWLTRRLREHGLVERGVRVWSRHGSTRWLWTERQLADRVDYVLHQQGEPMARWPE